MVIFFNKRMKHRGGERKVNGLLQLDYSICGAKALQTPNYEHGRGCKCGIARTPHQECLCAHLHTVREGWPSGGEWRAAQAPVSRGSLEQSPCNLNTKRLGDEEANFEVVQDAYSLCSARGIHNLSADGYDWGEMLTQCTTRRLPLFSCNILTRMTIFIF